MECGLIYLKILPSKESGSNWIQYCNVFRFLPLNLSIGINKIISEMNDKYKDEMISHLFNNVHPGCIVTPESVRMIAEDLYNKYDKMMMVLLNEHCIRCVYHIGEVNDPQKEVSIHHTFGTGLIKIGRYLDRYNELGLFQV